MQLSVIILSPGKINLCLSLTHQVLCRGLELQYDSLIGIIALFRRQYRADRRAGNTRSSRKEARQPG